MTTTYWTNGSALVNGSKYFISHQPYGAVLKLEDDVKVPINIVAYLPVQGIADGFTASQVTIDVVAAARAVLTKLQVFCSGKQVLSETLMVNGALNKSYAFSFKNVGGFVVAFTIQFTDAKSQFTLNGAAITGK
jgi:hypothetical protein